MICHTVGASIDPCVDRPTLVGLAPRESLSHFGEDHHTKMGSGTVEMDALPKSIGSMEQSNPFSVTESPLVDFDAVCQKVRAAVEPARAHAVSLHDENGDVLWLSESSMGPDEHNAVLEAMERFSNP